MERNATIWVFLVLLLSAATADASARNDGTSDFDGLVITLDQTGCPAAGGKWYHAESKCELSFLMYLRKSAIEQFILDTFVSIPLSTVSEFINSLNMEKCTRLGGVWNGHETCMILKHKMILYPYRVSECMKAAGEGCYDYNRQVCVCPTKHDESSHSVLYDMFGWL